MNAAARPWKRVLRAAPGVRRRLHAAPLPDRAGRRLRRRLLGIPLPPVELIQVGDRYFVRDGHHRISVARAFGEQAIDAEVTVWQVDGPLPWEKPAGAKVWATQSA